jgi:hypothetical protein
MRYRTEVSGQRPKMLEADMVWIDWVLNILWSNRKDVTDMQCKVSS